MKQCQYVYCVVAGWKKTNEKRDTDIILKAAFHKVCQLSGIITETRG
jgi:hypothetical protein